MLRLIMFIAATVLPYVTVGAAEPGTMRIDRAWARATPGSATVGAAYFRIGSPIDDRLIGLSSPVAGKAELHTHIEENGLMRMHAVEGGLAVMAGQELELKPGGLLHVMLIDLHQKLRAGDRFPLVLTFEKAGPRDVMVKVEPLGAMGPSDDPDVKHAGMDHGRRADRAMPLDGQHPAGQPGL